VVRARLHAEPFAIQHVGKPRQRVPVAPLAAEARQGPGHALPRQALLHVGILCHVERIAELGLTKGAPGSRLTPPRPSPR
jgi:hypothetical protein